MKMLRCLLVDDEPLARQRMARLLAEIAEPRCEVVASAGNAVEAMGALQQQAADVVFLDIHMPGLDGLAFAKKLGEMGQSAAIVFVTAHAEHAVDAFALHAADYLTKPVKAQRLQDCVDRIAARPAASPSASVSSTGPATSGTAVLIQDPRKSYLLDLRDAVVLRAELKYVSAITVANGLASTHVLSQSLAEIEHTWPTLFVRTHRNTLVQKRALLGIARAAVPSLDAEDAGQEAWVARIQGLAEHLPISRRQLPAVRQALRDLGL